MTLQVDWYIGHPIGIAIGLLGSCTAVRDSVHSMSFLIGMIYLEMGACRGQVVPLFGPSTSERECCGRSYLWLCLSASEVEELQNPLLIAKPAGFRCLARYLVPSGRSRVSRGLTHRLRDDLGGRRSSHVVDRLMGFIRQFHLSIMLTVFPRPVAPRVRAAPPARRLVYVSTLPVLLLRVM